MTAQPIGAPDWLRSIPGAAQEIDSEAWTIGTPTFSSKIVNVQAYASIYVSLTSFLSSMATVVEFFNDAAGTQPVVGFPQALCTDANSVGYFNIPCIGPYVQFQIRQMTGGPSFTGTLAVMGHQVGSRHDVGRLPVVVFGETNMTAGAGATVVKASPFTVSGPGSMYMFSTAASYSALLQYLQNDGTWQTISEWRTAAESGTSRQLWIPPATLRVQFTNNDGVTRAITPQLVVGG